MQITSGLRRLVFFALIGLALMSGSAFVFGVVEEPRRLADAGGQLWPTRLRFGRGCLVGVVLCHRSTLE
jgi:hypothetical protein